MVAANAAPTELPRLRTIDKKDDPTPKRWRGETQRRREGLRQLPFCAVASASKSKEILNAKVIVPGKSKGSFLSAEPLKLSGGSK
jgi:hypothetical protein